MKKVLVAVLMIASFASAFDNTPSVKLGYIYTSFDATQSQNGVPYNDSSASLNGADLGFDMNFYFGETLRWGLSTGLDMEFLNVRWSKDGLYGVNSMDSVLYGNKRFKNAFLWTIAPNVGVFADVFRNQTKDLQVRIFANLAASLNVMYGGIYDGVDYNYGASNTNIPIANSALSIPWSLGMRFYFIKHHSVEFAFKNDMRNMRLENKISNQSYMTNMRRNFSLALRYVFEWGQDW